MRPKQQSIHDYVVEQLKAAKGTWPDIAEDTGVSLRTIQKIASREIEDPKVGNIETLSNYFRRIAA